MLEHGRKIATILAADVVEYSRLMGVDDSGTLAALKARRAIFEQLVEEFDGREFGSVGDSLMAQFPSAVNAVRCAQAIQQAVAKENASLPPLQRMSLRIGVDLGDVIEENGTLFGDGVNVAARLQSLAAPGGILISGAVYEQVKKRLPANPTYAGARRVKNIPDPIATYEVLDAAGRRQLRELLRRSRPIRTRMLAMLVVAGAGAALWNWRDDISSLRSRMALSTAAAPAIAVLPFTDLTEKQSNAAFCDGLTEELLNSLARLPKLRVVARTSVFMFRGAARDVRDIGRQLGVTHVLEGSVRRSGERVRITAHLANTRTGYHDWSDDFERAFTDSLDIQQEIARAVVEAMQVNLTHEDELRLAEPRARDMQAYESYLLGRYHQLQRTPESLDKALDYYRAAIDRDPQFALAFAGLADAHMASYYYANRPIEDVRASMLPLVERALELNPRLAEAYAARGTLNVEQFRLQQAQEDLARAVALSPNNADAYVRLGAALEYDGRPREALTNLRRAIELDPLHFILHIRTCLVRQNLGQYEEARRACNRSLELRPDLPNAHWGLALIALSHGNLVDAAKGYRAALEQNPQRVDLLTELAYVNLDLGLIDDARDHFNKAIDASSPDQAYARVHKSSWYVARRDLPGLARHLRSEVAEDTTDMESAVDLALFYLLSGDLGRARQFAKRSIDLAAATPQILKNPYRIRWGRSSQLTLALIAMRSGETVSVEERLIALMDHLDELEREGHVWHGLEYLRASVHALRGETAAALAALERAYELGWRRAWWMRLDPAFAGMRREPAFLELIARIESDAARQREARVEPVSLAPAA